MSAAFGWAILAVVVTGFISTALPSLQHLDFGRLDTKIDGQGDQLRAEKKQLGVDVRTEMGRLRTDLGARIDLNTSRVDAQTARIDSLGERAREQTAGLASLTDQVGEHNARIALLTCHLS